MHSSTLVIYMQVHCKMLYDLSTQIDRSLGSMHQSPHIDMLRKSDIADPFDTSFIV